MDLYNLIVSAKLTKGEGGDVEVDSLSVSENGTYSAPSGHAYSPVTVSVPSSGITPTGTKNITENGVFDVASFASASVAVPIPSYSTSALTVTENGTYSVPSGVDGYNPVTVNVSGGGGGDHDVEDAIIQRNISGMYTNNRLNVIGSAAFLGCAYLSGVSFPEVTTIRNSAFANCERLSSASIPKAKIIGDGAFVNCKSLTEVNFPEVTEITSMAFTGCSRMSNISFPKATLIKGSAFYQCYSLTDIHFPSVNSVYSNAFAFCSNLISVDLPSAINLSTSAFYSCSKLETINCPNVSILSGVGVFSNCRKLQAINMCPSAIPNYTFNDCRSLMSAYLLSTSVATFGTNAFSNTPMVNSSYTGGFGTIYVPASLVDSYKSASGWSSISARITSYVE